jgi:CDP-diacylglycerol--glycerol-3-phosphate 3-phosphatidyltransferase
VERGTAPVSAVLRRTRVTANQLTGMGLALAVAAAIVIASGYLVVGALLVGVCGLPDLLDGPVAKATDSASVQGAFFDSVADRVTDSLLLGGVAWYLAGRGGGHLAVLPLGVLAATMLVSYIRAKAESLGLSAKGGLMERAERLIALGIGLIVQPFFPLLVPVLWAMLGLTLATAGQRFARVWRQAPAAVRRRQAASEARVWRPGRVESRWRAWREAAAARAAASRAAGGAATAGETWRPASWWPERRPGAGRLESRWRARRSGDPVERWLARRGQRLGAGGRPRRQPGAHDESL